jgi:hypothetical protein
LIRTLYPKIFSKIKLHKHSKGKQKAINVRRNAVIEFLSQMDEQTDLPLLFSLLKENQSIHFPRIQYNNLPEFITYLKQVPLF